jgi:peptide/nickel transport system permease protein
MKSLALLLALSALLLAAPWPAPHDPLTQHRDHASQPPQCGNPCFLLGTDSLGRDVFSRTLHGSRLSLLAGAGATLVALAIGGFLGILAASAGTLVDEILSRPFELLSALPWLYLLLTIRAAIPLGADATTTLLLLFAVVGVAGSGGPFRLARNQARSVLQGEAVAASLGLGASQWHILRHHLLPSTLPALSSHALILAPQFILAEVSLSFLGLGISEPAVSWGAQFAAIRNYTVLVRHWWMFAPVLLLATILHLIRHQTRLASPR